MTQSPHDDTKSALRVLAVATFLALPTAAACEAFIRHIVLPASFDPLRHELESALTSVAWGLACATALLAPIAVLIVRTAWVRRSPALVVFAVGTSLVQVPALLSIVARLFGARFFPVALTVAVSSAAIVALYVRAQKIASSSALD